MAILALILLAVEIWLLVKVGSATSAWFVIAAVIAAFFFGLSVIRRGARGVAQAGLGHASRLTPSGLFGLGQHPQPEPGALMDAVGLTFAGALLAVPGFMSDALGLLLLVPPVRRALVQRLVARRMAPILRRATQGRPAGRPSGRPDVEVLPPGALPQSPLKKRPVVIDVD